MKRKGFTLVELLAVIVILAVIALITIPLIGNVIEDSRKKAFESSVQGIVESANYYTIEHDGIYEFLFDEERKGMTKKGEQLDYKGVIEADGKLYIDSNGDVSLCLMNEKYYAYKNYNSGIYVGEKKDNSCVIGYDAITNKYVAMLDDGTGSISNVYSKEEINSIVDGLQEQITSNKNKLDTIESVVNTNQTEITNIKEQLSNMQIDTDNFATKSQLEALSSIVNTKIDREAENIYLEIKENTDSSTITRTINNSYKYLAVVFSTPNGEQNEIFYPIKNWPARAEISNYNPNSTSWEYLAVQYDRGTSVLTLTLSQKSYYQKTYGNKVYIILFD